MSSGFFILYLQFAAALPSRLFMVWLCLLRLFCLLCFAVFCCVWLCFKYLLCFARKYLKGLLLFNNIELAQCRLIGFTQIVTFVTSLGFTFLSCIALFCICYFCFSFYYFTLFVRLRWGFRSCGSDHGLCPLDSHKPLKRLDRNFYMDVLLILLCSSRGCYLWGSHVLGRV